MMTIKTTTTIRKFEIVFIILNKLYIKIFFSWLERKRTEREKEREREQTKYYI